jgi:hypothetical protein
MSDEHPLDLTDERDLHTVAALAQLIQSAIAFSLCLEDRAETLTVLQRAQTAALPRPELEPLLVAEWFKAGQPMGALADDYGRSLLEIEEAIRCELPLEAA